MCVCVCVCCRELLQILRVNREIPGLPVRISTDHDVPERQLPHELFIHWTTAGGFQPSNLVPKPSC